MSLRLVKEESPRYYAHILWHSSSQPAVNPSPKILTPRTIDLNVPHFVCAFDITSFPPSASTPADTEILGETLRKLLLTLDQNFGTERQGNHTLFLGFGPSKDSGDSKIEWSDPINPLFVRKGRDGSPEECDRKDVNALEQFINAKLAEYVGNNIWPLDLHLPAPYTGPVIEIHYVLAGGAGAHHGGNIPTVQVKDFNPKQLPYDGPQRCFFSLDKPEHREAFLRIWKELSEAIDNKPKGSSPQKDKAVPTAYVYYYKSYAVPGDSLTEAAVLTPNQQYKEENFRKPLDWIKGLNLTQEPPDNVVRLKTSNSNAASPIPNGGKLLLMTSSDGQKPERGTEEIPSDNLEQTVHGEVAAFESEDPMQSFKDRLKSLRGQKTSPERCIFKGLIEGPQLETGFARLLKKKPFFDVALSLELDENGILAACHLTMNKKGDKDYLIEAKFQLTPDGIDTEITSLLKKEARSGLISALITWGHTLITPQTNVPRLPPPVM